MAENRYHELLGLAPDVTDPTYYDLLEIERGWVDPAQVEDRFKQGMVKLQQIQSPKHKEFIEFLKGELKKARATLTDAERRRRYDEGLREERMQDLRKICVHVLVDGTLSQQGEISLIEEGKRLGLELVDVKRAIEEEIQRRGAKRVAAKQDDEATQAGSNSSIRAVSRMLEESRMSQRFAEARARHAEHARERAEETAMHAIQRAREAAKEAQQLVQRSVSRETLSAAIEEQEREQLEVQVKRLQAMLEQKEKELGQLRQRLDVQSDNLEQAEAALKRLASRERRLGRTFVSVSLVIAAALGGHALRLWVPGLEAPLAELAIGLADLGALQVGVGLAVISLGLLGVIAWLAGKPSRALYLIPTIVLAVLAMAAGAFYLGRSADQDRASSRSRSERSSQRPSHGSPWAHQS